MDQLQGTGSRHGECAVCSDRVGARQAQHWPQPLAARSDAVTHRVGDHRWTVGGGRQDVSQGRFDLRAARIKVLPER